MRMRSLPAEPLSVPPVNNMMSLLVPAEDVPIIKSLVVVYKYESPAPTTLNTGAYKLPLYVLLAMPMFK